MSYKSTKDLCSTIRQDLKTSLPDCKFSVVGENYSGGRSINVALMEGPVDVFNLNHPDRNPGWDGKQYCQLNQYQFKAEYGQVNNGSVLTPECWEIMKKATEIALKEHWDNSDPMTDYFNCNFYLHLAIGKWNKPYVKKGV